MPGTFRLSDHFGYSGDFGGLIHRRPREVLRPGSAAEAGRAVRDAARRGVRVVARGCGHSAYGQAQVADGLLLDMRGLRSIREVRPDRVEVDAGATWREVLDATLPYGRTPPVLTDYLDLTVGGTLSAGGVGGTSHRHGTQAGNALELRVVTLEGELVTCSPARHRELFDAVRGGLGRGGVIAGATLRLVPAPAHVLSFRISYDRAADLLAAQRRAAPRVDHIAGQARPGEPGEPWRYELRGAIHDGRQPPADLGEVTEVEELPFGEFADRMRPDVAELIALGEWARPHPWCMVFLPGGQAGPLIEETLATTARADIGLSGVVLINGVRPDIDPPTPGLPLPADPVLFGLLRTASPDATPAREMLAANRDVYERARTAGGTRYAVDALPVDPHPHTAG